MPNPNKYTDKQKFMEDCMHQVKTVEGKPQEQAVAQCLAMWRGKGKKKKKEKKCASDLIRDLSQKLLDI